VEHVSLPSLKRNTSGFSGNFSLLKSAFHAPSKGLCAQATVNGNISATMTSFFIGFPPLKNGRIEATRKSAPKMVGEQLLVSSAWPEYTPKMSNAIGRVLVADGSRRKLFDFHIRLPRAAVPPRNRAAGMKPKLGAAFDCTPHQPREALVASWRSRVLRQLLRYAVNWMKKFRKALHPYSQAMETNFSRNYSVRPP